jgi:hypothetical protein
MLCFRGVHTDKFDLFTIVENDDTTINHTGTGEGLGVGKRCPEKEKKYGKRYDFHKPYPEKVHPFPITQNRLGVNLL